jgi:hypothetical protein
MSVAIFLDSNFALSNFRDVSPFYFNLKIKLKLFELDALFIAFIVLKLCLSSALVNLS